VWGTPSTSYRHGLGSTVYFGPPPADAYEQESPVTEEFGGFTFEGVADELQNPSKDKEGQGDEPQAMVEKSCQENRDRNQNRGYSEGVAEPVHRMLVTAGVLRDPLFASAVAEHAERMILRVAVCWERVSG
jgi:hypothetical protein